MSKQFNVFMNAVTSSYRAYTDNISKLLRRVFAGRPSSKLFMNSSVTESPFAHILRPLILKIRAFLPGKSTYYRYSCRLHDHSKGKTQILPKYITLLVTIKGV